MAESRAASKKDALHLWNLRAACRAIRRVVYVEQTLLEVARRTNASESLHDSNQDVRGVDRTTHEAPSFPSLDARCPSFDAASV